MGNTVSIDTRYATKSEGYWMYDDPNKRILFCWTATYGEINLVTKKMFYKTQKEIWKSIPYDLTKCDKFDASMDEVIYAYRKAKLSPTFGTDMLKFFKDKTVHLSPDLSFKF